MPHRAACALLLATILVVPAAVAASTTGTFVLDGALSMQGSSTVAFDPLAILHDDTAGLSRFVLDAPAVRICSFTQTFAETKLQGSALMTQKDETCFALTSVQIELQPSGGHEGWVGIYPGSDSRVRLETLGQAMLESRAVSTIASKDASAAAVGDDLQAGDSPHYFEHLSRDHVSIRAGGLLTYEGAGTMKVKGPDVLVASKENLTSYATGEEESPPPIPQKEVRWLFIEFEEATILMEAPSRHHLAAEGAVEIRSDGTLQFEPEWGHLETKAATYTPTRGVAQVDGTFTSILTPLPGASQSSLVMNGVLRSTSLIGSPVSTFDGAWIGGLLALVGAGGLAAAGGGYAAFQHLEARRKNGRSSTVPETVWPSPPLVASPEAWACYYLDAAESAEQDGDWDVAITYLKEARKIEPTAELAIWQAQCHKNKGQLEEALAAYEEAMALGDSEGEADYNAAMIATARSEPEQAEAYLRRCLYRAPWLAEEIMSDEGRHDDPWRGIRIRHSFLQILDEARTRHRPN